MATIQDIALNNNYKGTDYLGGNVAISVDLGAATQAFDKFATFSYYEHKDKWTRENTLFDENAKQLAGYLAVDFSTTLEQQQPELARLKKELQDDLISNGLVRYDKNPEGYLRQQQKISAISQAKNTAAANDLREADAQKKIALETTPEGRKRAEDLWNAEKNAYFYNGAKEPLEKGTLLNNAYKLDAKKFTIPVVTNSNLEQVSKSKDNNFFVDQKFQSINNAALDLDAINALENIRKGTKQLPVNEFDKVTNYEQWKVKQKLIEDTKLDNIRNAVSGTAELEATQANVNKGLSNLAAYNKAQQEYVKGGSIGEAPVMDEFSKEANAMITPYRQIVKNYNDAATKWNNSDASRVLGGGFKKAELLADVSLDGDISLKDLVIMKSISSAVYKEEVDAKYTGVGLEKEKMASDERKAKIAANAQIIGYKESTKRAGIVAGTQRYIADIKFKNKDGKEVVVDNVIKNVNGTNTDKQYIQNGAAYNIDANGNGTINENYNGEKTLPITFLSADVINAYNGFNGNRKTGSTLQVDKDANGNETIKVKFNKGILVGIYTSKGTYANVNEFAEASSFHYRALEKSAKSKGNVNGDGTGSADGNLEVDPNDL